MGKRRRVHFSIPGEERTAKKKKMSAMDTEGSHAPSRASSRAGTSAQQGALQVGHGLEVTVPRAVPHAYNNEYTVRLTYADTFRHDLQAGSAGIAQYFRTTSVFDPDPVGTGHQPLGFDLWASQYGYYAVLACEYSFKFWNCQAGTHLWTGTLTAQQLGTASITVLPTTNTADYVTIGGLITPIAEMKNAQTDMIVPRSDTYTEFSGTLTPGDFLVDAVDSDTDTTWTAVSSNPAINRYIGYVLQPSVNTTPAGLAPTELESSIMVQVILNYTVQFTQVSSARRTGS